MDLSSLISITLSRTAQAPTRVGFATIGLAAYDVPFAAGEYARLYSANASGLAQMVTDGFAMTDPAYHMAAAVVAQNPHPTQFRVLRRATAFRHTVEIEPDVNGAVPPAGTVWSVAIEHQGVTRTYTRTSGGASKNAEATAMVALLEADAAGWGAAAVTPRFLSAAGVTDYVTIQALNSTEGLGRIWYYEVTNALIRDATADPGIGADLTAIETSGTKDFYGIALDSTGASEIAAAATWCETRMKILGYATQDSRCPTVSAADIMTTLSGANRDRTFGLATENDLRNYPAVAWMARNLALEPGSNTWAYTSSLSGPAADDFTSGEIAFLDAKEGNYYTATSGIDHTFPGTVHSGEYIDTIVLSDWTVVRLQEEIFRLLTSRPKIPYTDKGVADLQAAAFSVVRRQMNDDDSLGFVKGSEVWSAPKVADVAAADKQDRLLPNCSITVTFTGAIHKTALTVGLQY